MRRRLEIARGILHTPDVLFLDEPTIGLDPQTRRHIWGYLSELPKRHGVTIFMTTHYMDEAEYCDRIAIIDHGQIQAVGTPDELKSMVGGDSKRCPRRRTRRGRQAAAEQHAVADPAGDLHHLVPRRASLLARPDAAAGDLRPAAAVPDHLRHGAQLRTLGECVRWSGRSSWLQLHAVHLPRDHRHVGALQQHLR